MKWIAPVAAVLGSALVSFADPIQSLIAAHPALAGVFGALSVLAAAFAPRPQDSQK